jgi:erythronate-4-phosphate dehydrogenase
MKIVADENIPCVAEAFASLGEVELCPGRGMQAADVRDADILLVRSVTRVGPELLEGSRVRFVGSATIGFDHVDRDYLQARGIGFATAPGSNATSAAEYVVSALLVLADRKGFELAGRRVGIVGCGNVGSRVRDRLTALGMQCLVNDPPLKAQGGHDDYLELDDIIDADVITFHVPFTREGNWPTWHLADRTFLERLKPGTVLVNTARGAVVDNAALDALLAVRDDLTVVLDVWEGEPAISEALLQKVDIGTPHIAGYSLDGKLRGTEMIYRAACEHVASSADWRPVSALPARQVLALEDTQDTGAALRRAVCFAYDVREDDVRLRDMLSLPEDERPLYFDRLRKEYPVRREFSETVIRLPGGNDQLTRLLKSLGFVVEAGA